MGRVSLRKVVLENFRSFAGRHVLDLPESGVVILRGKNLDTRGDSGAGKTNVLLAIAYAFGICPLSAKSLQCWSTEDPMQVEVHMDTDEGPAILTRGAMLSLKVGKEKTVKGSAKAVEARLDKLCGVGPELRETLTYRDQVNPKKFLKMKDSELKSFLVQVLQLQGLEAECLAAVKRVSTAKRRVEDAKIVLDNVVEAFKAAEAAVPALVQAPTVEEERGIANVSAALGVMENDLAQVGQQLAEVQRLEQAEALALGQELHEKANHEEREANKVSLDLSSVGLIEEKFMKCRSILAGLQAVDKANRQTFENETTVLRQRARVLHNELSQVSSIKDNLARWNAEIELLEQNICGMCRRAWDSTQDDLRGKRRQVVLALAKLEEIKAHAVEVAQLDADIASRAFVSDERIAKLIDVRNDLQQQIAAEESRIRHAHDSAVTKNRLQAALTRSQAFNIIQTYLQAPERRSKQLAASQEALATSAAKTRALLTELNHSLSMTRRENTMRREQYDAERKRLTQAQAKLLEKQAEYEVEESAFKVESDYADMLTGFRNKIFDEVLAAISTDCTAIVGTLPNSQHISIEFRSERETLDGVVKNEIKPVTYLYGEPRPLKESVSGGQLTSIGLAVDLAVGNVISARLGCYLNWIILDEAFEGHDVITKQSCLEMLQTYAHDKLVIVVDHMNEVKDVVAKEITVTFQNKHSSFEKAA